MLMIPPPIRLTRKCKRCGLRYPAKADHCVHCHDLSDAEVESLKQHHRNQQLSHGNLGQLFLYIAIIVMIGMIVFAL
jgi:hypothetical protein